MDPKTICRMDFVPPRTNLKKISIRTNFGRKFKKTYPSNAKFSLSYNGEESVSVKKKGEGSYGAVYIVRWKDASVAVKIPIRDPHWETEVIEKTLYEYHHFIIPHRVIYDQWGNQFVIMQEANGDIFDLLNIGISARFRNKIIRYFTEAIGTLWRKGIAFLDMKSENLLYQCYPESDRGGGMALYFGDIGSFSRKGDEEYAYEVEIPEAGKTVTENNVLFSIGLLIVNMYDLKYESPKKGNTNSFMEKFYNPLKDQIKKHIGNRRLASLTLKLISYDRRYRDNMKVHETVRYLEEITTSSGP